MTTRISTHMISQRAVTAMLDQQRNVSDTQLQLSTGKRIMTASDDPAGAARLLDYNRKIDTIAQYQSNAERVQARLEYEEGQLTGVENILLRVKELAVQGNNDTLTIEQTRAIAAEVRERLAEMMGLANARDASGEHIFAGYQTQTEPFNSSYAYQGDLGDRKLQISEHRQISDGNNGYEVFVDVPTAAGKQNLFQTIDQLATDLENNADVSVYLDDLSMALSHVLEIHSTVGARLNAIEEQMAVNSEVKLIFENHRMQEGDLDYTEAISRFERQMVALQASQQAFIKVSELSLFNFLR